MAYTSIKRKCKCSPECKLRPKLGYAGFSYAHAPEAVKEKVKAQTRAQRKAAKQRLQRKVLSLKPSWDEESAKRRLWFAARNHEMTGTCQCGCGRPSSKDDPKYSKYSACHILPQRHFKSVQWHPFNFIEMAFWGGCHTNFDDRGSDRWNKLACWPEVVRKFKILYPLTLPEEREFIPKALQRFAQ